jgi:hypothetical protein
MNATAPSRATVVRKSSNKAAPTARELKAAIRRFLQKHAPATFLDTDCISVTLWRDGCGADALTFDGPGKGEKLREYVACDADLTPL